MISLAKALFIAFERQSDATGDYICNISEVSKGNYSDISVDGYFDFEDIADELKDILLEE